MTSDAQPAATRMRPIRIALTIAAVVVVAGAAGTWAWDAYFALPRRFAVVEPGRLYRSGEVEPAELRRAAERYGIRTVLSLLNPDDDESKAERAMAEKLGLRWLNVPLTGDGASTPEARDRIRAIMLDDSLAPLLVHCAAGANRTGLACGIYRINRDGWTYDQVLAEMKRYRFEDKPKHENLRNALRAEAEMASSRPAAHTRTASDAVPVAKP